MLPLQVLSAWRLVVQHRCWYDFACHLLVRCSMAMRLQQQQQQPRKQELGNSSSSSSSSTQLAGRAAAFVAWVQQPADASR
jgi:hypothetical protein